MTQFYIIKNEQVYSGEYSIDGNLITVYAGGESKTSQLNGMKPEGLAGMLLKHLVREGYAIPVQTIPVFVKNGLRIFQLTETNIDGSVIVTFLVSGPLGSLGVFNSRGEAEAFLDELLSEEDDFEPEPPRSSSSMGMS